MPTVLSSPNAPVEDLESDMDQFYETIQETDINQSNVPMSEQIELDVNRSYVPNSAVQLNQTEAYKVNINQSYIPISTLQETDMNQSNVPTSKTEQNEAFKLGVNRLYIPSSTVQLDQTEAINPDMQCHANQSYIPTPAIEVSLNMTYGAVDDGIDLSTNQAYNIPTSTGTKILNCNVDPTELDMYEHDKGMEYEHD